MNLNSIDWPISDQKSYSQAVLRANQGAVDATIDQLLAMTTDNENEKLRNEIEQKETTGQSVAICTITSKEASPTRWVK